MKNMEIPLKGADFYILVSHPKEKLNCNIMKIEQKISKELNYNFLKNIEGEGKVKIDYRIFEKIKRKVNAEVKYNILGKNDEENHVHFLSGLSENEIWDREYRDLEIKDENAKETAKKLSALYIGGGVRIAMGLFYTDEEWEEKRKRILNTPLP